MAARPTYPPLPPLKVLVTEDPQCEHAWLIDTPSETDDPHSRGRCARCGGVREFANYVDQGKRAFNAMHVLRSKPLARTADAR